jgi:hypothetical protein
MPNPDETPFSSFEHCIEHRSNLVSVSEVRVAHDRGNVGARLQVKRVRNFGSTPNFRDRSELRETATVIPSPVVLNVNGSRNAMTQRAVAYQIGK